MPKLFGKDAKITPVADVEWHRILIGTRPGLVTMQAAQGGTFEVPELLDELKVDEPRTFYFSVTQMVDGVESEPSNEVAKVLTLRETILQADPPPAPVLSDVEIDIPVSDDMPNREYSIEVSNP